MRQRQLNCLDGFELRDGLPRIDCEISLHPLLNGETGLYLRTPDPYLVYSYATSGSYSHGLHHVAYPETFRLQAQARRQEGDQHPAVRRDGLLPR